MGCFFKSYLILIYFFTSILFANLVWADQRSSTASSDVLFTLVDGKLTEWDEKSVFTKDTNIKLKQVRNDSQCSKQFTGEINGVKYSAEIGSDKVEFQVSGADKKIEIDMVPNLEKNKKIIEFCSDQIAKKFENDIENCLQNLAKRRQVHKVNCEDSDCSQIKIENQELSSLHKKRNKAIMDLDKLNENFKTRNNLTSVKSNCFYSNSARGKKGLQNRPSEYICKLTDESDSKNLILKAWYLKNLAKFKEAEIIASEKIKSIRSSFFRNLHKVSHYINSISRCCNLGECRSDLSKSTSLKSHSDSSR